MSEHNWLLQHTAADRSLSPQKHIKGLLNPQAESCCCDSSQPCFHSMNQVLLP